MQLLNLNEKEQTLTSLLRFRLYWKDFFLSWNPDEYDGITDSKLEQWQSYEKSFDHEIKNQVCIILAVLR